MRMFIIYWYPKCPVDCEKRESYVLCNNQQEAWKIANEMYKGVQVAQVCSYASISGGREDWQPYWADFVMHNGEIMNYKKYSELNLEN